MLTREIAEAIVQETMTRLKRNINIMNESGIIIASGDASRLEQVHEGALEVIRTGKSLVITAENKEQWKGALSGINLPTELQNKIVGVIGITGEPREVEEFGGLVKMTTELILKQAHLVSQLEWKQRTIDIVIEELTKTEPRYDLINERLHLLQIQLRAPFNVCIIEIHERTIRNQTLIQKIEEMISENHPLIGFLSVNKLFILMSGLSDKKVQKKLERMQEMIHRMGI